MYPFHFLIIYKGHLKAYLNINKKLNEHYIFLKFTNDLAQFGCKVTLVCVLFVAFLVLGDCMYSSHGMRIGQPCKLFHQIVRRLSTFQFKSLYRNLPSKGASPNKGLEFGGAQSYHSDQNQHSFFDHCLIFNPKRLLKSLEPQLCLHIIRLDIARMRGTLIRQNAVIRYCQVLEMATQ